MRRDRRRRDLVKCEDMRLFAQRAIRYVGEKNVAEFEADEILQAAVYRAVSTVGEAARRVYEVVKRDLPPLLQQLTLLVSTLEEAVGWDEPK